jgi:hypothetical protein
MADSLLKQLKSRFKTDWLNNENLSRFYNNFERVEALSEKLKAKKDQLAKSTTLTDLGKAEGVRDFAAKEIVPKLRAERLDLEASLARMADHRKKLSTPEINGMDTVAAMQRQEIRTFLRGLPDAQRVGLLLGSPDAQTIAAVMEMPAVMSGLTDDMRGKVQEIQLKKLHPQILELHENAEQAIGLTDSAIRMTLNELRRDGGFEGNDRAFDVWMETVSAATDNKPAASTPQVQPVASFVAY